MSTNPLSTLLAPLTNSCRQAITTKYICPTNHRGSRVKATAEAGSVMIGWDDGLSSQENHAMAALALAKKFNWLTPGIGDDLKMLSSPAIFAARWVMGGTANGYVFVDRCVR